MTTIQAGISVVIPVYRSGECLHELHQRLTTCLSRTNREFELIFVEDCGGDDSWSIVAGLSRTDERVRGIRLRRNYGQHNAVLCGVRHARYDTTVTMDDDLQHPPEVLDRLLDKLDQGFDVVYGTPEREQHGLFRDLASQITKLALQQSIGASTARSVSAYRVFRTELRTAFTEYRSPSVNMDVLLTWGTSAFAAVRVPHEPRRHGESGYTFRKLVRHTLNMMTGFSELPLHIASVIGFGFAVFGVLILAFVLLRWLIEGSTVPGFAFLASIIAIFSGAQLLALGVIGEYLARMHFRTMERPVYIVGETVGRREEA